ncbi:MAG TPA: 4Fe-4S ferredoxin, partial [Candidatus Omnitrophica bacterium]|nr:4Fe-4S ferredoxin [Candidatus Omnitrophota bacterium]
MDHGHGSCPGSRTEDFRDKEAAGSDDAGKRASQLKQWPIQLHL